MVEEDNYNFTFKLTKPKLLLDALNNFHSSGKDEKSKRKQILLLEVGDSGLLLTSHSPEKTVYNKFTMDDRYMESLKIPENVTCRLFIKLFTFQKTLDIMSESSEIHFSYPVEDSKLLLSGEDLRDHVKFEQLIATLMEENYSDIAYEVDDFEVINQMKVSPGLLKEEIDRVALFCSQTGGLVNFEFNEQYPKFEMWHKNHVLSNKVIFPDENDYINYNITKSTRTSYSLDDLKNCIREIKNLDVIDIRLLENNLLTINYESEQYEDCCLEVILMPKLDL
mmetsp:Transcript_47226/g.54414  ORF Transcript_47226/g.54414 Transcript_47226/m.54414 type:complete len:280 (-) Transcript_47226:1427-2266(-)